MLELHPSTPDPGKKEAILHMILSTVILFKNRLTDKRTLLIDPFKPCYAMSLIDVCNGLLDNYYQMLKLIH